MPQLTVTDKLLQRVFLPLIPRSVTPNMVTWFRFLITPFVMYLFIQESYLYGLILFIVSSFSDAVDGSLARTRNQITKWGTMYDPAADKLLISSAAFILVSKFLNWYLAATIIGIEFFLLASAYYRKRFQDVPIQAEFSGKIKMVLQSLGVAAILISLVFHMPAFLTIAAYLLYLAVVFAVISLAVYKSI